MAGTAGRSSPEWVRPNMSEKPLQGISVSSPSFRRIVLLGKIGAGKSASGNTILGQKKFRSEMSMSSVTRECSEAHATVSGRSVSVVDTPGFFDTQMNPEELAEEVERCVYLSSPGPHAFLIVFPVIMRFTEMEKQIPQMTEMIFGEGVLKYSIILFSYGDWIDEPIEELIKENSRLRDLVDQCGGRFHIFNNKDQNNRDQVNDLLQKIDTMIEKNGGHYSNQMFEDALRFRQEEEESRRSVEEKRKKQEKGCEIKMEETILMPKVCLHLVLLGRTGAGKSSTGNTILGRQAFIITETYKSVTRDVAAEVGDICGFAVTVYDTPGFSGTESKEQLEKYQEVLQKCGSGLCAFLLILQSDIFTQEDQKIVEKIEELLIEKYLNKTWILFTRGDQLEKENKKINKVINETESLKKLTQKYEGRWHMFNNKTKGQSDQVKSLIAKVFQNNFKNFSKKPWQSIPINIHDISADSLSFIRIVLLGKRGAGKSAAGNTILGQKVFESSVCSNTVTRECSERHATVSGRSVSVVDTPGFFDTQMNPEELMMEIAKSAYLSSPGPHAFFIVFNVNTRITEQEEKIPHMIEILFGQEVLKYSIILFTHGDQLKGESMGQVFEKNGALRRLVDQCGGRFHVFNNKDQNNREQVNDLQQKTDTMIEQNGGGHYSNQMFEDAWRFRQEEREGRQREEKERQKEDERRRREDERRQEEMKRREEIKRRQKEERERTLREEEQRQREYERRQREEKRKAQGIFSKVLIFGAACAGAVVAAPVGAVLAGAAGVTAAVGAVAGAVGVTAAVRAVAGAAGTQRRQEEEEEQRQQEKNEEEQNLRT